MATYVELYDVQNENEILHRIVVATAIAAETIRTEDGGTPNHANRLLWAALAFGNPSAVSRQLLWAVLAANKDATVANITGATDAAIQANVDAVVDIFATGG